MSTFGSYFTPFDPRLILDAIRGDDMDLAAALWGDSISESEDYLANLTPIYLSGTLDGAGAAVAAHNIDTGFTVRFSQAFEKGASADEFVPLTIDLIDATNVTLSGGTAATPYKVTLLVALIAPDW